MAMMFGEEEVDDGEAKRCLDERVTRSVKQDGVG
jgi:hypothetical protein